MDLFLNVVISIFENLLKLADPLLEFLAIQVPLPEWTIPILGATIPAGNYSMMELFFGVGLPIFLLIAFIKFVLDVLPT